jgi:AcrR family transcriptional regulator
MILTEAGVSRKTLYYHFDSKDDLILEALKQRDRDFCTHLATQVENRADEPWEQVLAIFDVVGEWFLDESFFGCTFINASAEFSQKDDPCRLVCASHKQKIHEYVLDLTRRAGVESPSIIATQLCILMEGSIVQAHVLGDKNAAASARDLAETILSQAVPVEAA